MNCMRSCRWGRLTIFALYLFCLVGRTETYLTKDEALLLAFPGAETITETTVTVSPEQEAQIGKLVEGAPAPASVTYFVGRTKEKLLGYAVIAEAPGRFEPFTFLLAVTPAGAIRAVEILLYQSSRGREVRQRSFLKQFGGKTLANKLRLKDDIKHVAGATLSCRGLTESIRTQLAALTVLVPLPAPAAPPTVVGTEIVPQEAARALPADLLPFTRAQYLMGTLLEVQVFAPDRARADGAMTAVFAEVARLEALFSTFRPTSEMALLNRAVAHQAIPVSPDSLGILAECQAYSVLTKGAFDVTVGPLVALWQEAAQQEAWPAPACIAAARARVGSDWVHLAPATGHVTLARAGVQVNLGAIGKGYALDGAAAVLRARGITAALLNFGGQLLVVGVPPGAREWRVEVRDPRDPWNRRAPVAVLRLTAGSVATTADYARGLTIGGRPYSHIVDPRTGQPVVGMQSVTVIAPTATAADALSTGLFVLGMTDGQRLAEAQGWAVLMLGEGTTFLSPAFLDVREPQMAKR
jgi:thiamine biosynthesis lipoprotein